MHHVANCRPAICAFIALWDILCTHWPRLNNMPSRNYRLDKVFRQKINTITVTLHLKSTLATQSVECQQASHIQSITTSPLYASPNTPQNSSQVPVQKISKNHTLSQWCHALKRGTFFQRTVGRYEIERSTETRMVGMKRDEGNEVHRPHKSLKKKRRFGFRTEALFIMRRSLITSCSASLWTRSP